MRHFPVCELGYAIGFVVLLAALYFGAYYAMVGRVRIVSDDLKSVPLGAFPEYAHFPEASTYFFGLAHEFDRLIRPDFWIVKP
jgi:hypothetical protein